ncbi:aquaporin-10-like [Tropilaelaps mercedesae]|uniref:Aquaporin-10-like n=1 Tax=Tropilaelaps mercedesae TaxID=418985 RepID=A0A1V9Y0K6_9ACAR|nr:aquaporin-10-like [Tropilaelaps mercedesae]
MYSFLTKCRIENSYVREFFSEFIATFIFMLIGESSMVHLVIKKEHDILAVAFCWGIAVMMGLLTGGSNSGGHINPIVTTGFASLGKFPWIKVPHYVLGQHLGSFAAASLVHFNSLSLLNNYDRGSRVLLGTNGTGILLTTYPDMHVPTGILVLDTIICSGLLNFGIMVIVDKNNCNVPNYLHSLYVGLLVMAIVWALGANCMAGINPARDFPPRVLAVMVGYKDAFSYRNFWWIPLFMTHVGGTIGCYLYQITIGNHTPIKTAPIAEIRELKEFSAEPQGAKA